MSSTFALPPVCAEATEPAEPAINAIARLWAMLFFMCAGFRGSGFPPLALIAALIRFCCCFHFFRRCMIVRMCLLFERAISSPLPGKGARTLERI